MAESTIHLYDSEDELLNTGPEVSKRDQSTNHSLRTAPVFTSDALEVLGNKVIPQRAVYGSVVSSEDSDIEESEYRKPSKLYVNTNAPFSAVICGLQGSGKSHSTSVLLEGCLIQDSRLGTLPAPLCGLLFHFDSAAGSGFVQPCEAAYLASLDAQRGRNATAPEVTILVMPNRLAAMKAVYANLPGVRVEALRFAPRDISGERLLAMMKVDENNQMPLYMELILTILRDMEVFDYNEFRETLARQRLNGSQKSMLNLRLALLDSCLKGGDETNTVTTWFKQGALTIVDLSSPFIDASSACGFFDIILSLFVEAEVNTGKIIVLDEAHKYLNDNGHASQLTDSLLSIIRQQRHLNARIVISTQEPTVVPSKFLELSSFIIAHRFSSPKWLKHLSEHAAAAQAVKDEIFEKIIDLRTGEGILFAPSGLKAKPARNGVEKIVTPLGQEYLVVHSRQRITRDGGHSFLAVQDEGHTRLGRVAAPIPRKISNASHDVINQTSVVQDAWGWWKPTAATTASKMDFINVVQGPTLVTQRLGDPSSYAVGKESVYPVAQAAPDVYKPPLYRANNAEVLQQQSLIPESIPSLIPVTLEDVRGTITANGKGKNPTGHRPSLTLNTHSSIVLQILRTEREKGVTLISYRSFKKHFMKICSIGTKEKADIALKEFLVEESHRGSIIFGFRADTEKKRFRQSYLKLPDSTV